MKRVMQPPTISHEDGTKSDEGLYTDLLDTQQGNVEADISAVNTLVKNGTTMEEAVGLVCTRATANEYMKRHFGMKGGPIK